MRKLILTTIFSIVSIFLFGQDIEDVAGDFIGSIDSTGQVRDNNSNIIYEFLSNGNIIHSSSESLVGKIQEEEERFLFEDANGDTIGSINSSNEVFDVLNKKIGEIDELVVKDLNNDQIGSVSEQVRPEWLAAYFFFYFENTYK